MKLAKVAHAANIQDGIINTVPLPSYNDTGYDMRQQALDIANVSTEND